MNHLQLTLTEDAEEDLKGIFFLYETEEKREMMSFASSKDLIEGSLQSI